MKASRLLVPGIALAIASFAFAREARAASFAPGCTGTTGDSAALITAIQTSNGNGEADTITLGAGCTYELTTVNNDSFAGDGANGLPFIQQDSSDAAGTLLTIVGNGAKITRASTAPAFRLFTVNAGAVVVSNLTFSGGEATTRGGGVAILGGNVVFNNVTVSGNKAGPDPDSYGGGIQVEDGTLALNASTVSGNMAPASDVGGINVDFGTLVIVNSTISGNTTPHQGGGVYNFQGIITILNSTIAGNSADEGGGTWSGAAAVSTTVTNTIIALNTATGAPADAGAGVDAGAPYAPDVGGLVYTDGGNNLIGDATGTIGFAVTTLKGTSAAKIDPLLGPLASNGGLTQTRALLAGSPAVNAASSTVCAAAPVSGVDQRAVVRPAACDIGSFEQVIGGSDASIPDGATGNDASSGTDSGTVPDPDSGTIGDVDAGKTGGTDGGDDAVPVSSSSCSCDNAGAPGNALGLSALVLGAALLVARRRRR
ncbi:MAG: polymorphic outer membrane protein [Myxococcaceae bacterium]|nr:polymorphic outer membrane protein [Myxococcaceae bacterium]